MLGARPESKQIESETIDCIELPVLIVDRELTVVGFNPAAAALLSIAPAEYGRKLDSFEMLARLPNLEDLCEHVIATGSSHRLEVADCAGSWFSLNVGCRKSNQVSNGAVL